MYIFIEYSVACQCRYPLCDGHIWVIGIFITSDCIHLLKIFYYFTLHVWVLCLQVCLCIMYVQYAERQKESTGFPELES